MKTVTLEQFLTFSTYWLDEEDSKERLREIGLRENEWTALDVLALEEVSADDRLWTVLREDFLSKNTLYEFALLCAEHTLTIAKVTNERCWNAIKVKRAWVRGEASDDELDTARHAAKTAAWAASQGATQDTALYVALVATCDAAWNAAWAAAWVTAWVAAQDASRVAERKVKRRKGYSHERAWQVETLKRLIVEEEKYANN